MTPSSHLLTEADFCARGYRGLSVHQTTYSRRGTPVAIISERLSPSPPLPPQWAPSYSISCPVNTATGYTQMGVVCSHTPFSEQPLRHCGTHRGAGNIGFHSNVIVFRRPGGCPATVELLSISGRLEILRTLHENGVVSLECQGLACDTA